MKWACLVLLALLAGCNRPGPLADLLPDQLDGVPRTLMREIDRSKPPEPVKSVERIMEAHYGDFTVRVYQTEAPALGLEFVQRWQAPRNAEFFYEGRYVAVITWPQPDRPNLQSFGTGLRTYLRRL